MGQVVTSGRFLSGDTLDQLAKLGIEIQPSAQLEALSLPEPKYGETVVGELTNEEARTFRELYEANAELESLTREMFGRSLAQLGESIRSSDARKPLSDALGRALAPDGTGPAQFSDADEAVVFHRLQMRCNLLHATFYWMVGERLSLHDWRLGVRANSRVVKIERRW